MANIRKAIKILCEKKTIITTTENKNNKACTDQKWYIPAMLLSFWSLLEFWSLADACGVSDFIDSVVSICSCLHTNSIISSTNTHKHTHASKHREIENQTKYSVLVYWWSLSIDENYTTKIGYKLAYLDWVFIVVAVIIIRSFWISISAHFHFHQFRWSLNLPTKKQKIRPKLKLSHSLFK